MIRPVSGHTNKSRINFFKHILFRVRIGGESMWPGLVPGRAYWASSLVKPKKGSIIVFKHPRHAEQFLVKRIAEVTNEGYRVESSVSWGSSSDNLGIIDPSHVTGTLLV